MRTFSYNAAYLNTLLAPDLGEQALTESRGAAPQDTWGNSSSRLGSVLPLLPMLETFYFCPSEARIWLGKGTVSAQRSMWAEE